MNTTEIIKITVDMIIPLLVFVFGILLLRKVEGIKTHIERQSHFTKKWADLFFDTCHEFMNCVERAIAILHYLQQMDDPGNEIGTRYQREYDEHILKMIELELRIRRMTSLAPWNSQSVKDTISAILKMLEDMHRTRKGNADELFDRIAQFNEAVHKTHNEMLARREN